MSQEDDELQTAMYAFTKHVCEECIEEIDLEEKVQDCVNNIDLSNVVDDVFNNYEFNSMIKEVLDDIDLSSNVAAAISDPRVIEALISDKDSIAKLAEALDIHKRDIFLNKS